MKLDDAVPYTPAGFRKFGLPWPPVSSTLARWRLRGIRGIRPETFLLGGRRYITRDALAEFIAATTAAVDGGVPTAVQLGRTRDIEKATEKLTEEGL